MSALSGLLAELADVNCGREPVFAQRYHPNDGRDRKIYGIGGRLFGVKKIFPRRTEEEKHGEPFTLTPELCELAARSEEHTSELQSRLHLVCRLLLEKKKVNLLDEST